MDMAANVVSQQIAISLSSGLVSKEGVQTARKVSCSPIDEAPCGSTLAGISPHSANRAQHGLLYTFPRGAVELDHRGLHCCELSPVPLGLTLLPWGMSASMPPTSSTSRRLGDLTRAVFGAFMTGMVSPDVLRTSLDVLPQFSGAKVTFLIDAYEEQPRPWWPKHACQTSSGVRRVRRQRAVNTRPCASSAPRRRWSVRCSAGLATRGAGGALGVLSLIAAGRAHAVASRRFRTALFRRSLIRATLAYVW